MRYQKTIDLWADGVQDAITSGALKLQPGQWCICGTNNDKRCRFVRVTPAGTIHVAHWQGTAAATQHRFKTLLGLTTITAMRG